MLSLRECIDIEQEAAAAEIRERQRALQKRLDDLAASLRVSRTTWVRREEE